MLRYLTAGESHGRFLAAILEGMPAGLKIEPRDINLQLKRRQGGYGRGGRMKIEEDKADIIAGLRSGLSIGSPICVLIENKDFSIDRQSAVLRPRPGHADLAGAIKYATHDARDILERASARETAARVAVGAVCRMFLNGFGITFLSHVVNIGGVDADTTGLSFEKIKKIASVSKAGCADKRAEGLMIKIIDRAKKQGDTLGGIFEVMIKGVPAGLGSYVHYDRRLDARLAGTLMSIPGIKGVEIGLGFGAADKFGSTAHDEIFYAKTKGFFRKTNFAGGFEGGLTNGQVIVLRAAMKPISTLKKPLNSVNMLSKRPAKAQVERADTCAVSAAGVVGEGVCAFEIARAFLEKFGGDSMPEIKRNYNAYLKYIKDF